MARTIANTGIGLGDSEVVAVEKLSDYFREKFGSDSMSETLRTSITQSSLLKRDYKPDVNGILTVERSGRKYRIPSGL